MRRLLKTFVALPVGLALAGTLLVGSPQTATAAPSCNVSLKSYGTVRSGSKGKTARAAECLVRGAGYKTKVNSSFSSADARQLKKFQKKVKLKQTGVVDRRTWTALLSRGSKPTLKVGKRNSSVKRLQNALTASGRKVPATSYFGSITKSAVKSVQKSQGWKQTGTANSSVWRALQSGGATKVTATKAAKKPAKRATTKKKASSSSKGAKAVAFAKKQLGDRYRYGATGPGSWDCSGLTGGAWKAAGVKIPRTSQAQYRSGRRISKSDLKPGDLVFFYSGISHVAIYAGGGKVIHASRPGTPVQYIKMSYMPFAGARRPA